jgi:hypothetical protein
MAIELSINDLKDKLLEVAVREKELIVELALIREQRFGLSNEIMDKINRVSVEVANIVNMMDAQNETRNRPSVAEQAAEAARDIVLDAAEQAYRPETKADLAKRREATCNGRGFNG